MNRVFFFSILAFALSASPALAQTADPFSSLTQLNAGDIDVVLSPENPGARETVTITLRSDIVDLNRATISWTIQGTNVRTGVGQKSLSLKTLDYGQAVTVGIQITTATGENLTKTLTLQPEDMTVLWEATDAYAPAFYRGKRLPGREALITVAAIPNFNAGPSARTRDASFVWERNGSKLPASSGWQRDSILIKHNSLRASESVGVTATNQISTRTANKSVLLTPFKPQVLVYTQDAETGLTNPYAIRRLTTSKPVILAAEPFGFSRKNPTDLGLVIQWLVNGASALGDVDRQSILVNPPEESGIAQFQTKVTSPGYTLQDDTYATEIIFPKL
jgi:hypothetical protein